MFPEARRNRIKEIIIDKKKIVVSELAIALDVSEETIRRDLAILEKSGMIIKSYGGAVLKDSIVNQDDNISNIMDRKITNVSEKNSIGRKAAELVRENQMILIDASSTTLCMIKYLKHIKHLTVITNSIDIAMECSNMKSWDIIVIGGKLYKSLNLISPNTEHELRNYNVDISFLGASGVAENGFTSADVYEAEVKAVMLAISKTAIVLMDDSKLAYKGAKVFAPFNKINMLYINKSVNKKDLDMLSQKIPEIILC